MLLFYAGTLSTRLAANTLAATGSGNGASTDTNVAGTTVPALPAPKSARGIEKFEKGFRNQEMRSRLMTILCFAIYMQVSWDATRQSLWQQARRFGFGGQDQHWLA
jgi:hypothetical protein